MCLRENGSNSANVDVQCKKGINKDTASVVLSSISKRNLSKGQHNKNEVAMNTGKVSF